MKAYILNKTEAGQSFDFVENHPMPAAGEGEVIIKIDSTSVNRVDLVMVKGYPGMQLKYPHIIGGDITGTIVELGSLTEGFSIGDRVVSYPIVLPKEQNPKFKGNEQLNDGWQYYGMHRNGSYCEYAAAAAYGLIKLPAHVTFEDAATMPVAGLTAYHGIMTVGNLQPGDVFMIWGGSGGLGCYAIQLAKAAGATVITTVGKDSKKNKLLELGADYVFNHYTEDSAAEVRKLFPGGLDVILDYVGPATFDKSFSLLRKNGKLMLCGMLTGMEVKLHIQQAYFRHLNINGLFLGSLGEFKDLAAMISAGKLKPQIHDILPLEQAAIGHKLMAEGEITGKVVLKN
ncbi:MAG: alcohol dehydrogenase [Bacteroidota bacterium]|nr:alcohol dehydrogenase [Bacteroidota bacterium]